MVYIGFIIKILLWILAAILGIIVLSMMIILFAPISYNVECEKYTNLQANVRAKIFFILGIHYTYSENNSDIDIRIINRLIKKIDLSGESEQTEHEAAEEQLKEKQPKEEDPREEIVKVSEKIKSTEESSFKQILVEEDISQVKQAPLEVLMDSQSQQDSDIVRQVKVDLRGQESKTEDTEIKEVEEQEENTVKKKPIKEQITKVIDIVKKLWNDPNRNVFIKSLFKMLIDILNKIKPKLFWFELLIGRENPADTGDLMAKLAIAYPFYAPFGIIEGSYEEEGYWGEVKLQGTFNVYQLLKPVIVFGLNKEVRAYIKTIMSVGKE